MSATPGRSDQRTTRFVIGALGLAGVGFGVYLLQNDPRNHPVQVVKWAIGSDIVVDGVLIPAVILVGWLLRRVAPRARRYLAGGLVVAGSVTVIALPLIRRQGKSAPGQGLLEQRYLINLAILLGFIAATTVVLYAVERWRPGRRSAEASSATDAVAT